MTSNKQQNDRPVLAHILPFIGWILLMQISAIPSAWRYTLQMGTGILMLAYLKPWRWYSRLNLQHIVPALLIGILVFVAWVGLETTWIGEKIPSVQSAYLRFGLDIFHFGQMPPAIECTPYAPSVCGWHLALIRLLGSAFVIATIEEFFWRGFLYRMFIDQSFLKVDIGRFVLIPFILVCLFFGLEHTRWIAGIFAGVAYGYLIIRTRDIWAGIIAHITTNFLLGIYVLMTGSYQFW